MILPELLAPAGNYECFLAAVNAGADAVYLAGDKFGARAYAGNFSDEEILLAIRHAHLFNVKIYLTVNTLVKESETELLKEFLAPFVKAGLDGVIVQDLGAAYIIKNAFPKLSLSASTQMTITGSGGAKLLESFGFSRIIPARELSLEEIRNLCKSTSLEVEVFIHGAMCYCYSGQCLFSSMLGDRSANRGRCAGPCRMEYETKGSGKKYMLSLKDLVTIDYIPDLIQAGVGSFKIEGRMKPPEYVAGIVSVYRKCIDNGIEALEPLDYKILKTVYVRSNPRSGYMDGTKGSDMISLESPAYTPSDESVLEYIRENIIKKPRTISIDMTLELIPNRPAALSVSAGDTSAYVEGAVAEQAQKAPLTADKIEKSLTKLGDSPFRADSVNINISGNVFMPVSAINELRRQGVSAVYEALCDKYEN